MDLMMQLQADAEAEVPPFGAESVRIAQQMGAGATNDLLPQLKAPGNIAFLALEALRGADPAAYNALPVSEKAAIYVTALRNALFYNAWGLPGHQLTQTAQTLIALGEDVVPILEPLLADQRLAPSSGSQDATTSKMYNNRLCDYAWVFISEIRHQAYIYYQSVAERDKAIEALRRELTGT